MRKMIIFLSMLVMFWGVAPLFAENERVFDQVFTALTGSYRVTVTTNEGSTILEIRECSSQGETIVHYNAEAMSFDHAWLDRTVGQVVTIWQTGSGFVTTIFRLAPASGNA